MDWTLILEQKLMLLLYAMEMLHKAQSDGFKIFVATPKENDPLVLSWTLIATNFHVNYLGCHM